MQRAKQFEVVILQRVAGELASGLLVAVPVLFLFRWLTFIFANNPLLQHRSRKDECVDESNFGVAGVLIGERIDHCDPDHDKEIGHVLYPNRIRSIPEYAENRKQAEGHSNSQVKFLQRKADEENSHVHHDRRERKLAFTLTWVNRKCNDERQEEDVNRKPNEQFEDVVIEQWDFEEFHLQNHL